VRGGVGPAARASGEGTTMLTKLVQRLDALAEAAEAIRGKATAQDARHLDGLAVAEVLLAVDKAARKLAALGDELQPQLFPGQDKAG
jgi:hypothetical protein